VNAEFPSGGCGWCLDRHDGRPASLGAGDMQIARVISKLRATGYRGPLLIECDTSKTGLDAIRNAADYLRTLVS
jgi:sugar phosphate isomerase/epimerase